MAGQIIKRGDDTWLVRIFTGRDAQGRRRYLNKTIKGKKKDAETYLSKTQTAISTGTFVEPSTLTVDSYLNKWLQTAACPRVTERTYTSYEWLLKNYVRPVIGEKRLSDIRPLDIQSLYNRMASPKLKEKEDPQPGITYGLGLSARSVRYTHSVLSSALKQAVRWNMLTRNPCELVELPRHTRREMQAFSPEEAARFLKAAAEDAHGTVFTFALATGMRPEEYLALKWSDVDLHKGAATVQRALIWRKGGEWYFGEPKTARSRRTVPLPASVLSALQEHKRRQGAERLKTGASYQTNDLVFAMNDGRPILLRTLDRLHFKPTLKRAKLSESFRLYDLRHSCATLLLAANEHPKVVSERLGHANIILTLDTYSHVLPSMQQAASEKLEGILFKKTGTE
jgi:integrase